VRVVDTFAAARKDRSGVVGLVPTMGYLHEGHLSLIERAGVAADTVVVSLYVNPLQFDEEEDLARYPADLERDAALAELAGADVLFAPSDHEVYAGAGDVSIAVGRLGEVLEGVYRPGHFAGVATMVAKLLAGLRPDQALFGRKDAQQLAVVRALVTDLSFPVEIVGCPTIRERDGLALSSRNTLLDGRDREAARTVSAGLMAAADAAAAGEVDGARLAGLVADPVAAHARIDLEYAELAAQDDAVLLDRLDRPAFLAVAARVGSVRLIDNIHFDFVSGRPVADRGHLLETASVLYGEDG